MRLLLLSLVLAGCGGGGGGSSDDPDQPNPPACCASTALIAGDFDDGEQSTIQSYEDSVDAIDTGHASAGTNRSGAHLQDRRDAAILAADVWTFDAFEVVDGYADTMAIDGDAVVDLVEDYRDSLMAHVLAEYDNATSSPLWNASAVAQIRAEIVTGMNAEFDQLQNDLAAAGHT